MLTGVRAIALVLRNPLADHRARISAADPDKSFEATAAIGYLLRLLRDFAPDHAAERWMRGDARGLLDDDTDNTEDRMAA